MSVRPSLCRSFRRSAASQLRIHAINMHEPYGSCCSPEEQLWMTLPFYRFLDQFRQESFEYFRAIFHLRLQGNHHQ